MTTRRQLPLRFHCVLGADAPRTPFHRRGNFPKVSSDEVNQNNFPQPLERNNCRQWKRIIVVDQRSAAMPFAQERRSIMPQARACSRTPSTIAR